MLSNDTILMDSSSIDIVELHPNEMQLLKILRSKFRYGDVTIIMQDGLPVRIKRITEFENLKGT